MDSIDSSLTYESEAEYSDDADVDDDDESSWAGYFASSIDDDDDDDSMTSDACSGPSPCTCSNGHDTGHAMHDDDHDGDGLSLIKSFVEEEERNEGMSAFGGDDEVPLINVECSATCDMISKSSKEHDLNPRPFNEKEINLLIYQKMVR
ncbi:hypothetical protein QJS04_geneDACA006752 [Acorus gramineus]|uniref:Uncharacterized protein n=1 Tax=Acorus gramineus TaxID=55184 RepID=A0AAV9AWJ8_ACOGR|nr:hypothetical protein QJS04_geneDACA006752 [Acorus gramineus]